MHGSRRLSNQGVAFPRRARSRAAAQREGGNRRHGSQSAGYRSGGFVQCRRKVLLVELLQLLRLRIREAPHNAQPRFFQRQQRQGAAIDKSLPCRIASGLAALHFTYQPGLPVALRFKSNPQGLPQLRFRPVRANQQLRGNLTAVLQPKVSGFLLDPHRRQRCSRVKANPPALFCQFPQRASQRSFADDITQRGHALFGGIEGDGGFLRGTTVTSPHHHAGEGVARHLL